MNGEAHRWLVRGMAFVLGGGIVILGALVAGAASSVIVLVFIAILLGSALDPVVDAMRDHTPLNRAAAILAVYASLIGMVIATAVLLAPVVATQIGAFSARLPGFLQDAHSWASTIQPRALGKGFEAVLLSMDRSLKPSIRMRTMW